MMTYQKLTTNSTQNCLTIMSILAISATPMKTIEGIKAVFNLKGDKAEVPDMYLGASIQKVETADGT